MKRLIKAKIGVKKKQRKIYAAWINFGGSDELRQYLLARAISEKQAIKVLYPSSVKQDENGQHLEYINLYLRDAIPLSLNISNKGNFTLKVHEYASNNPDFDSANAPLIRHYSLSEMRALLFDSDFIEKIEEEMKKEATEHNFDNDEEEEDVVVTDNFGDEIMHEQEIPVAAVGGDSEPSEEEESFLSSDDVSDERVSENSVESTLKDAENVLDNIIEIFVELSEEVGRSRGGILSYTSYLKNLNNTISNEKLETMSRILEKYNDNDDKSTSTLLSIINQEISNFVITARKGLNGFNSIIIKDLDSEVISESAYSSLSSYWVHAWNRLKEINIKVQSK